MEQKEHELYDGLYAFHLDELCHNLSEIYELCDRRPIDRDLVVDSLVTITENIRKYHLALTVMYDVHCANVFMHALLDVVYSTTGQWKKPHIQTGLNKLVRYINELEQHA